MLWRARWLTWWEDGRVRGVCGTKNVFSGVWTVVRELWGWVGEIGRRVQVAPFAVRVRVRVRVRVIVAGSVGVGWVGGVAGLGLLMLIWRGVRVCLPTRRIILPLGVILSIGRVRHHRTLLLLLIRIVPWNRVSIILVVVTTHIIITNLPSPFYNS